MNLTNLLIKLFIKDSENVKDPDVREKYGTLAGIMGIIFNVILFAAKYFAGIHFVYSLLFLRKVPKRLPIISIRQSKSLNFGVFLTAKYRFTPMKL